MNLLEQIFLLLDKDLEKTRQAINFNITVKELFKKGREYRLVRVLYGGGYYVGQIRSNIRNYYLTGNCYSYDQKNSELKYQTIKAIVQESKKQAKKDTISKFAVLLTAVYNFRKWLAKEIEEEMPVSPSINPLDSYTIQPCLRHNLKRNELLVLANMTEGYQTHQIARILGVSTRRVKFIKEGIKKEMDIYE